MALISIATHVSAETTDMNISFCV